MKTVAIPDYLDEAQIAKVVELWNSKETTQQFHREVVAQVIAPNMAEINRKLGQENDPDYLAYAIEYVFTTAEHTITRFSGA